MTHQVDVPSREAVDRIVVTDDSPVEIAAAQSCPLPRAAVHRLNLSTKGYRRKDVPAATFTDKCPDLTRPLVSRNGEGKGG